MAEQTPRKRPSKRQSSRFREVRDLQELAALQEQAAEPAFTLADRYQVTGTLGQGGMGAVYQAVDTRLDRAVAIKTILPQYLASPQASRRFFREAQAMARLNHPNILTLFDYGQEKDLYYLVMELGGRDLGRLLAGRATALPLDEGLPIVFGVCRALEYAHSRGVVHRDLKPANVLVGPPLVEADLTPAEGGSAVKVMDFGLAKVRGLATITRASAQLGTPQYMSPEQALGREADERSDLYALGILLYEVSTGVRPFDSDDPQAILYQHLNTLPVLPSTFNPQLPAAVEDLIMGLLAKEPFNRPASASEVRRTLGSAVGEVLEMRGGRESSPSALASSPVVVEQSALGPLQPLLDDPEVSEIMVNSPQEVFIHRRGVLQFTGVTFLSTAHLTAVIQRIAALFHQRVDPNSPVVDGRLEDGSRVHIVAPPIAVDGPTITIRKFSKKPLTVDDLIRFGSLTPELAEFIRGAVAAKLNIIVSGGTGSGKTTLLNVVASLIPENQRIVSVEEELNFRLRQPHVVRLETGRDARSGANPVTFRELVQQAVRLRPDRIVVGELHGPEAFDVVQAMDTGHEGTLACLHATSPGDALLRLERMILMAGTNLPSIAVRQMLSSAIHLMIQLDLLQDGSRRVTHITEIAGIEGDQLVTQDIFRYEQIGLTEEGKIVRKTRPTGLRPLCLEKIAGAGVFLPSDMFS